MCLMIMDKFACIKDFFEFKLHVNNKKHIFWHSILETLFSQYFRPLLVFDALLLLLLMIKRTFLTLQFAHPLKTKNCSILLMNEVNIGNCSVISTCSAMGGCTPITEEQGNKCLAKVELRGTYFRNTRLQGHHLELSSSIIIFLLFLLYLMGTA